MRAAGERDGGFLRLPRTGLLPLAGSGYRFPQPREKVQTMSTRAEAAASVVSLTRGGAPADDAETGSSPGYPRTAQGRFSHLVPRSSEVGTSAAAAMAPMRWGRR